MYSLRMLFFCLVLCMPNPSVGQNYEGHRYEQQVYFALGIGSAGYYGDLQDEFILPNYSITSEIGKRLNPHLGLRGSLSLFRLSAKDANSDYKDFQIRNLSFFSTHLELSTAVEISLFKTYTYGLRDRLNPFLFVGIGTFNISPRAKYNGKKYKLREFQTEGVRYAGMGLAIPFGIGVKLKANKTYTIVAELGYRLTNSDYLDDVSAVYPNLIKMSSLARALSDRRVELGYEMTKAGRQRGNPSRNDGYFIFTIKVQGKVRDMF